MSLPPPQQTQPYVVIVSSESNRDPMKTHELLCTISEALHRTGIGRTFLYERMADGSIRSVKAGRRRLVDVASLTAWVASLPQSDLKLSAVAPGKE